MVCHSPVLHVEGTARYKTQNPRHRVSISCCSNATRNSPQNENSCLITGIPRQSWKHKHNKRETWVYIIFDHYIQKEIHLLKMLVKQMKLLFLKVIKFLWIYDWTCKTTSIPTHCKDNKVISRQDGYFQGSYGLFSLGFPGAYQGCRSDKINHTEFNKDKCWILHLGQGSPGCRDSLGTGGPFSPDGMPVPALEYYMQKSLLCVNLLHGLF